MSFVFNTVRFYHYQKVSGFKKFATYLIGPKQMLMLEEIFKYIPKAMLTESFILNAINRSIYVFKYVPDKMKTETICRAALHISTHIIDQIPRDIVIPEVLILCRKSKYPSAKILDKWMQKWVETQEVSDEYLMMALDNAPKTVKKTANWQKWARHFYKNESK